MSRRRTAGRIEAGYRVLALALLLLAMAGVDCARPASAAEPNALVATGDPDPTTTALADDLRALGRALVQRQLPKGAPALPDTHPMLRHALAAAPIVATETIGLPPTVRTKFARVVYTMAGFESGWQANPKGSNDKGSACGPIQLHDPQLYYQPDVHCDDLRKDLRLGFRAGMAVLWDLSVKYGTLAAGLTAYATDGSNHGAWVLPEIAKRCALAGVDCTATKIGGVT